ncbi:hypothetical protein M5689_000002 [Euphorbia peplus]|nr:hypothetical protein M5689_000002 [Euphorbia peplus]
MHPKSSLMVDFLVGPSKFGFEIEQLQDRFSKIPQLSLSNGAPRLNHIAHPQKIFKPSMNPATNNESMLSLGPFQFDRKLLTIEHNFTKGVLVGSLLKS